MTFVQQIITIGLCILGTMLTRFLPFFLFSEKRPTPAFIRYLGKALPGAIFGMLVIYCLKNAEITTGSHGIPEALAVGFTVAVHLWKKQMLLSIAGGTIFYMILVQTIF